MDKPVKYSVRIIIARRSARAPDPNDRTLVSAFDAEEGLQAGTRARC
jgi:hypothetical protein